MYFANSFLFWVLFLVLNSEQIFRIIKIVSSPRSFHVRRQPTTAPWILAKITRLLLFSHLFSHLFFIHFSFVCSNDSYLYLYINSILRACASHFRFSFFIPRQVSNFISSKIQVLFCSQLMFFFVCLPVLFLFARQFYSVLFPFVHTSSTNGSHLINSSFCPLFLSIVPFFFIFFPPLHHSRCICFFCFPWGFHIHRNVELSQKIKKRTKFWKTGKRFWEKF